MSFLEIFLIGVGLSMDAFAVAVGKGLSMKKVNMRHCLIIALFFGGFQALMPIIGFFLGSTFAKYIEAVDHWIAFFLLLYIGGKMLVDGIRDEVEERREEEALEEKGLTEADLTFALDIRELFVMAVATSIDALAVGVSFSFLRVSIFPAASIIGITTFLLSVGGIFIGNLFGTRYKNKATIAGGIILIIIGLRILLSHLLGW